jgi:hypothetical protein
LDKDKAIDRLVSIAENDEDSKVFYKLVHYESDKVFYPEDVGYIVVKFNEDNNELHVVGVYDQYEMIPQQFREDEDYWIDNIDIV